jgi:hypothetical protein
VTDPYDRRTVTALDAPVDAPIAAEAELAATTSTARPMTPSCEPVPQAPAERLGTAHPQATAPCGRRARWTIAGLTPPAREDGGTKEPAA